MAAKTACEFESHGFRSERWAHRPTGRCWRRMPEIRVRFPVSPLNNIVLWPSGEGCSLTRRRSGVRVPPGRLAQRRLDTPTGRATRLKPECLRVRILLWALNNKTRLGRQLADHFGSGTDRRLVAEMLRVRIPPELLANNTSSWSSGVLACLSRRRSWVQIPSRTLTWHGTQTGKAAKLKPS